MAADRRRAVSEGGHTPWLPSPAKAAPLEVGTVVSVADVVWVTVGVVVADWEAEAVGVALCDGSAPGRAVRVGLEVPLSVAVAIGTGAAFGHYAIAEGGKNERRQAKGAFGVEKWKRIIVTTSR